MANAQGSCTRLPYGEWMMMRQSPPSSGNAPPRDHDPKESHRSLHIARQAVWQDCLWHYGQDHLAPNVARSLTVELCFQYSLSRILITILCWFTPMQSLAELTRQTSLRQSETIITPILIPMPKWQARGAPGSRNHHYPISCDLLNLPGGSPQSDDISHAGFVYHFLIKLAHSPRTLDQSPLLEAPPRTCHGRVWCRHWSPPSVALLDVRKSAFTSSLYCSGGRNAEKLTVVGARHHADDSVEHRPVEILERCGTTHKLVPIVRGKIFHGRGRDGLLCEHVQRVAGHMQWFYSPFPHAFHAGCYANNLLAGYGKNNACETPPTLWSARPTRCNPDAIDNGAAT